MSSLIVVTYRRELIMLVYSFWSMGLLSSSASSVVVVGMGVKIGLASPMSNFFRT
jgi:hypothetical protein